MYLLISRERKVALNTHAQNTRTHTHSQVQTRMRTAPASSWTVCQNTEGNQQQAAQHLNSISASALFFWKVFCRHKVIFIYVRVPWPNNQHYFSESNWQVLRIQHCERYIAAIKEANVSAFLWLPQSCVYAIGERLGKLTGRHNGLLYRCSSATSSSWRKGHTDTHLQVYVAQ